MIDFFDDYPTPSPFWHTFFPSMMFEYIVYDAQGTISPPFAFYTPFNNFFVQYIAYLIGEFYKEYPSYEQFFSRSNFTCYLLRLLGNMRQSPQFKIRSINFLSAIAQLFFRYLQRPFLDPPFIYTLSLNEEKKRKILFPF